MSEVGVLQVATILKEWDMRGVHKLRDHSSSKKLRRGQCLVAFNKAMTIGRIIDTVGGVHTYYAEPKTVFDVDSLSQKIAEGFWVSLRVGRTTKKKADALKQAA